MAHINYDTTCSKELNQPTSTSVETLFIKTTLFYNLYYLRNYLS
jgi:hypothetical protein